jgi:hypothetical protein
MGLIDKLVDSSLGLKGQTPAKRAGATASGDLHYDAKTLGHTGAHTNLEPGGQPTKYTDRLPK